MEFWQAGFGVKWIPSQVEADHIIGLQLSSGTQGHLVDNADGPSDPSHHGAF